MHPDLETLVTVDGHDRTLRGLEGRVRAARERHEAAQQRVVAAQSALADTRAALDQAKAEDHALSRKLHLYRQRRASALGVLEGGGGDPMAAERQLKQCETIIDDTETASLELMERQDALEAARSQHEEDVAVASGALEEIAAQLADELSVLEAEIDEVQVARDAAFGTLSRDLKDRYGNLVRRKGTAVAPIVEGYCKSCRMIVRQQLVADLKRGLIVPCPGCRRWLAIPGGS